MDPHLKLSSIEQPSLNVKLKIPSGSPSAQESTQYHHAGTGDMDDDDDDDDDDNESICDGCVPLVYSDECDLLPSTAPVDHMHIIECLDINEETILKSLRLADGIATVLYNWKEARLGRPSKQIPLPLSSLRWPRTIYPTVVEPYGGA